MPGCTHPKWLYQLVEDFNVYLYAKNKIHHWLLFWDITFSRILQFDWLTAFWPITWETEFCQIWDWWWHINNKTISFHFRLTPRKTNDNIFQKIQKTLFAAILDPFAHWSKMNFPRKKGSVSFYIFQLSTILPKNRKTLWAISEKNSEIDRQQWFYRALRRTGIQKLKTCNLKINFFVSFNVNV